MRKEANYRYATIPQTIVMTEEAFLGMYQEYINWQLATKAEIRQPVYLMVSLGIGISSTI